MPDVTDWPVDRLRANPHNPRRAIQNDEALQELAASIVAQGVVEPLLITTDGTVIVGHRRLAAARLAGLSHVPCLVRDIPVTTQVAVMLVENLQRSDLTPVELAEACAFLQEQGMRNHQIAKLIGTHHSNVSRWLAFLKLPQAVRTAVTDGRIQMAHGSELMRFAGRPDVLERLLEDIPRYGMTVHDLRALDADGNVGPRSSRALPVRRQQPMPDRSWETFARDAKSDPLGLGGADRRTFEREIRFDERTRVAEFVRRRARETGDRAGRAALFEVAKQIDDLGVADDDG